MAGLVKQGLTQAEGMRVINAACLVGGYGHALSDHERGVIDSVVLRFRRHGHAIEVSASEWAVIAEALAVMRTLRDAHSAAPAAVA